MRYCTGGGSKHYPPNDEEVLQYLDGTLSDDKLELVDMKKSSLKSTDREPQNGRGYQFDGAGTVEFAKADIDFSGSRYIVIDVDMSKEAGETVCPIMQRDDTGNDFRIVWNSDTFIYVFFANGGSTAFI